MQISKEQLQAQLLAFEKSCREADLRLTHQRLEVYRELAMATDHPSAEALHQRLRIKIPTISLDTVYRTQATFTKHGLINQVETTESQARFEDKCFRHHHLICSECAEIIDFQWAFIDQAPLPEEITSWGRIDHTSIVVYGVCQKCLK